LGEVTKCLPHWEDRKSRRRGKFISMNRSSPSATRFAFSSSGEISKFLSGAYQKGTKVPKPVEMMHYVLVAGTISHRVAKRSIACEPFFVRASQQGNLDVCIIVDLDFFLIHVEAVQPAHILLQRSPPGNRHCKQKRVEASVIKTFPEIASRRQHHTGLTARNGCEGLSELPPLPSTHPTFQDKYVRTDFVQAPSQVIQMLRPTRQNEWRASRAKNSLKVPNN
jgi:hypothetical protein